MGVNTKIEWATHTFNPWIGCSRVHAGCQNCYAEAMAGRLGVKWGPNGTRRRTAASTWKQVEKWNRAETPFLSWSNHERPRVFPSLCDPFEDWDGDMLASDGSLLGFDTMDDVFRDFFALMDRCPNLDFLLLTKRPENIRRKWPSLWGINEFTPPGARTAPDRSNVWLIYSASDQETLEAGLHHLWKCLDLVPVLGLSMEPLLGPVEIDFAGLSWCVVGGESGPHARPCDVAWIRSVVEQCRAAEVPCFVKQDSGRKPGQQGRIPDELWAVKQFPRKDA